MKPKQFKATFTFSKKEIEATQLAQKLADAWGVPGPFQKAHEKMMREEKKSLRMFGKSIKKALGL